jgi:hypothetical protein
MVRVFGECRGPLWSGCRFSLCCDLLCSGEIVLTKCNGHVPVPNRFGGHTSVFPADNSGLCSIMLNDFQKLPGIWGLVKRSTKTNRQRAKPNNSTLKPKTNTPKTNADRSGQNSRMTNQMSLDNQQPWSNTGDQQCPTSKHLGLAFVFARTFIQAIDIDLHHLAQNDRGERPLGQCELEPESILASLEFQAVHFDARDSP